MSRITGFFCMRGKGFKAIKCFQHRMTSNIYLAEANFPVKYKESSSNLTEKNVNAHLTVVSQKPKFQDLISQPSDFLNAKELHQLIELEDTFLALDDYSISKTLQLLKFLAAKNYRILKVLNAISKIIIANEKNLTYHNCSDILYCWSKLSYKNKESLDIIANAILCSNDKVFSSKTASYMLLSMGRLKYRNISLLDFLLNTVAEDINAMTPNNLLKVIITLATVNYMCPEGEKFLKLLSNYEGIEFTETQSYAQFVWANVILNKLMEGPISKVLSKEYLNLLSVLDASLGSNTPIFLKLQNINGAAMHLLPSYSGTYLQQSFNRPLYSKSKSQFLVSVVDGLTHLFPKHGHMKTMKDTGAGFILDIECCVDAKGNPVMLSESDKQIKIGILLSDFNDFCISDDLQKTGITSFKERILKGMGYRTINIPYTDYVSSLKLKDKKIYLQKKIKECLELDAK